MKERNFKGNLIMMMAVVLLCALFCSCNAAGGATGDETVSSLSGNSGTEYGLASISVNLPSMKIEVSADGNKVEQNSAIAVKAGEELKIAVNTLEGSVEAEQFMMYVGAEDYNSIDGSFSFETAHPGEYNIMVLAANGNGSLVDSVNFRIIVK